MRATALHIALWLILQASCPLLGISDVPRGGGSRSTLIDVDETVAGTLSARDHHRREEKEGVQIVLIQGPPESPSSGAQLVADRSDYVPEDPGVSQFDDSSTELAVERWKFTEHVEVVTPASSSEVDNAAAHVENLAPSHGRRLYANEEKGLHQNTEQITAWDKHVEKQDMLFGTMVANKAKFEREYPRRHIINADHIESEPIRGSSKHKRVRSSSQKKLQMNDPGLHARDLVQTKQSKNEKSSKGSKECFGGVRIECGLGKVSICTFNTGRNMYGTECMAEDAVRSHLAEHKEDYYGECEQDTFVRKSVLLNVPPDQGTEDIGNFDVDYDVTYNQDGVVILSKSSEIIDGVLCSSRQVEVLFAKPLTKESLPYMFPTSAILVVDGTFFGMTCDPLPSNEFSRISNVAFFVIESSQVVGSIATIAVTPTILDSIFEEQKMHYKMSSTVDPRRRLFSSSYEVKIPPESPVQIVSKVETTVTASAEFDITSTMVRLGGIEIFGLSISYPRFEMTAVVDYHTKVKHTDSIKLMKTKFLGNNWESEGGVLPDIPIASVPVPGFLLSFLNVKGLVKRLGLVLTLPLAFQYKAESYIDYVIKLGSGTVDLGGKRVKLGMSYDPLKPILPWEPIWEVLENKDVSLTADKEEPEQDEADLTFVRADAVVKFEARLGIAPQLRLDCFGFAWIGIGSFIGIEVASTFKFPSYGPSVEGWQCDKCHHLRVEPAVVVRDLFLKYKTLGMDVKPKPIVLVEFIKKLLFFRLCLITREDNIKCGDMCCEPGDICVDDLFCKAPGLCLEECCSDKDCSSPSVCNLAKKCECPYDCCTDDDCSEDELCDGAAHQCTTENHKITKPPLKILHIGDSYSSGVSGGMYSGPEGCYRSDRSWGKLFSDSLSDRFSVRFVNRACSGGVIEDYNNKKKVKSQLLPCRIPREDEIMVQGDLLCEIYVQPQSQSVTKDVDMVLLTIGGNDLGFLNVILSCFMVSYEETIKKAIGGAPCRDAVNNAKKSLDDGTYQRMLTELLADVTKRMSPQGTVILSSYPHILTNSMYVFRNTLFLFDSEYDAGKAIRSLAIQLDGVQRATVESINAAHSKLPPGEKRPTVHFFDKTKDVFNTHEPDPSDQVNPTRWIAEPFDSILPYGGIDFEEWYHPLPIGQVEWAKALSLWSSPVVIDLYDEISKTSDTTGGNTGLNNIDLVFVIDSTSSMSNEIASVKAEMANIVYQITTTYQSYRVGIVTYQDYPDAGGSSGDYPSRVDLDFSDSLSDILRGVNSITLGDGGDPEETVLSGLNTALNLKWRSGVTKIINLMGDAPPKIVSGKEPISGLTEDQIIMKSEALDPVQIMAVDLGVLSSEAVKHIVVGTGGAFETNAGGIAAAIKRIIDQVSKQPFAWFGESIVAKIGRPILFDASGSYDPQGEDIISYEWDFNGDGVYDESTDISSIIYTYNQAFDGFISLRVSSVGGRGFASAHIVVNVDGSISQADATYCKINETSSLPIIVDQNGIHLRCLLNSTLWHSRSSFDIAVANDNVYKEQCLGVLGQTAASAQSCELKKDVRVIIRQIEISDIIGACSSMEKVVGVIRAKGKSCLDMCMNPTQKPPKKPTKKPTKKKSAKKLTRNRTRT